MPSIAPPPFDWEDTPNPKERAFAIVVKEGPETVLPALGTGWQACPDYLKRAADVRGHDEQGTAYMAYKLALHEKADFQMRRFLFVRPKTDRERMTPFKSWKVRRPKDWPLVLHKLWFEEGTLPLSSVDENGQVQTVKQAHERVKYRDAGVYPTVFLIEHFLSEVPYDMAIMKAMAPITDSIHWSFDGNSGSFPECLHPKVSFPRYQTSGKVLFGIGTEAAGIGADVVAQEFAATPMEDWEAHAVSDEPQEIRGQWFRERVTALPPIDDRESTT